MSVYVGSDVHRERSRVAVVTEDGQVQLDKNVVNGSEPMLRLIGDLPPRGTRVALRCKAIASARLKNDKGRRAHKVRRRSDHDRVQVVEGGDGTRRITRVQHAWPQGVLAEQVAPPFGSLG